MIPLLVATSNPGKFREFQDLLGSFFKCEALPGGAPSIVEDGQSYFENALKKAEGYYAAYQRPVLSDDSGLEVDVLAGDPGVDSAIYGGETISWAERWAFLYRNLQSHCGRPWTARFRCVLCYFDGIGPPRYFEGLAEGKISEAPSGSQGFGYDPVFFSTVLGKTLGVATPQEKAAISHRAKAAQNFLVWARQHVS